MTKEKIIKSLDNDVINKSNNKISNQVVKSLNEDLKQATFVVMVPDEIDLHGDVVSEAEVRKACHNFNRHCNRPNLFHVTKTTSFDFVESYCSPVDFTLNDRPVKKGTWLTTIQVYSDDLWQMIKSGDICSVSIGAIASVETIDD